METTSDLNDALTIDVGTMDSEFTRQRQEAVRRRFLAGLIQEVSKLPSDTCLWINLSTKSSPDWVMGAPTKEEHDRLVKEPTSEGRLLKKLVKDLGTTRSAISSATRATQDAMAFRLGGWRGQVSYSAEELVWVAQRLLADPVASFHLSDAQTMKAAWLEMKTASIPGIAHRGPRL